MILRMFFVKIIKQLVKMALTEKFLVWALRVVANKTSNKWDDSFVDLIEAGRNNDTVLLQKGVQGIVDRFGIKVKNPKVKNGKA